MRPDELTLSEYKESVKRTCPDLGSETLNKLHMILGMNSEFNEVVDAIDKSDEINIGEELTDIAWYLANYANMSNFDLNKHFGFHQNLYFYVLKHNNYIEQLQSAISKLTDHEKKILAYKKVISQDVIEEQIIEIAKRLNDCYTAFNLNPFICMKRNIDKLKVRFPEKFSEELANNRNLELELEKLKGE